MKTANKEIIYSLEKRFSIGVFLVINLYIILVTQLKNDLSLFELNTLSIIQLLVNCIIIYFAKKKIGIAFIFYLLSYIFHQSQLLLTIENVDIPLLFETYSRLPINVTTKATIFVLYSNICLAIGILWGMNCLKGKKHKKIEVDNQKLSLVSGYIACFSIPFCIYRLIIWINLYRAGGYLETYESGINGIVSTIAAFFSISFCLWINTTQVSKKKIQFYCFLILIYEILVMSTGNRYNAILDIVCIFMFYRERFVSKVNIVKVVVFCIVGYFALGGLMAISQIRGSGGTIDLSQVIQSGGGAIYIQEAMAEFGCAIYNVSLAIQYFPETFSMQQFIKIFITPIHIIPGLSSLFPGIEKILYYIYNFPDSYAMGGSYIGEMYFWAGKMGCLLAIPLGAIVGFVQNIRNNKAIYLALKVTLYFALLRLIRGYLFESFRTIVWFLIIVAILMKIHLKYIKFKW